MKFATLALIAAASAIRLDRALGAEAENESKAYAAYENATKATMAA